jgi:hypothetical protein
MMNAWDFLDSIDDRITSYVAEMEEVQAEDLELDRRSAYRLYVDADRTCIVTNKRDDRTLQYYGGFEYVDKEYRREVGNWVFYFAEDDRVQGHLDRLSDMSEDEETDPGFAAEA